MQRPSGHRLHGLPGLLCLACLGCFNPALGRSQTEPPLYNEIASPDPKARQTVALDRVLLGIPVDRRLEITTLIGNVVTGFRYELGTETLTLVRPGDTDRTALIQVPVREILLVREEVSAAGRNAIWGFTTGAVIGGAVGVLMGLVITSMNDVHSNDTWPVAGGALVGAVGGGAVLAGAGALIGSFDDLWREVYRRGVDLDPAGTYPAAVTVPERSARLGLYAGLSSLYDDTHISSGGWVKAELMKDLGGIAALGPELAYYGLGGSSTTEESDGTVRYRSYGDVLQIGLGIRWSARGSGFKPYLAAGPALYIRNDAYFGANFGGGLEWRFKQGQAIGLDLRYHISITGTNRADSADILTLGLALSAGL